MKYIKLTISYKESILDEKREYHIYFQLSVNKKPTLSKKLHLL